MTENMNILNDASIRKLMELIYSEIVSKTVATADVIPMDAASATDIADKDKAATVGAVFTAMKTINHVQMKFVKGTADKKTFEAAMEGVSPAEMTFYIFKENDIDSEFDLYVYDSQQGKYVKLGTATMPEDVDLSGYWSKEELDITEYVKKSELGDITTPVDTTNFVTKEDLDVSKVVLDENLVAITATEVETIWNEVKSGTVSE